jgi:hypothetical protein
MHAGESLHVEEMLLDGSLQSSRDS